MDPLIWLALAGLVGLILIIALFIQRRQTGKKTKTEKAPATQAARGGGQGAVIAGGVRRSRNIRSRLAAVQRARQSASAAVGTSDDDNENEEDSEGEGMFEEEEENKLFGGKKIGTKKLRKIQEKAEKKALREQEEAAREDRKRRQALQEEERKRELELEQIQKEKEEEEQRKLKEEQERQEQEEYERLRKEFVLEEEGEDADEEGEEQKGIRDFIEYIKNRKVVYMEDLAAEFNMKTQDAISRVQSLQESGELTGVIDDRGKFIFISQEELQAIASFIKQRGRVSIAELVSSSNTLVNLQPESSTITT